MEEQSSERADYSVICAKLSKKTSWPGNVVRVNSTEMSNYDASKTTVAEVAFDINILIYIYIYI